jgi:hypothetical protein
MKERKKKFSDLGDFRERMKNALNQQQLDKICRYITVDSWGNEKSFLYGKYKDTDDKKDYNHIDEEPTPEDPKKIFEKRYPININVASWEILATVFANIKATHNQNPPIEIKIDIEEAIPLAKSIVKDRTKNSLDKESNNPPFKTWNEVEDYLYNYFKDKDQGKDKAEAIFAVIYPGMLPNKKSPNRAQYRKFDKMDVEIGTTECCLFSPGVFYCEAIGRVIEYGKKPYTVLAHSKVSVNMKLWEPYIVNSQSDFESQRTTKEDSDAWTGIEGGITPPTDHNNSYNNNVIVGYLQERQEEKEVNKDKPCRYWQWSSNYNHSSSKDEDNKKEMRSDGLFMLKEPQNFGVVDELEKKEEWQDDGFDLWIKPSYDRGDNQDDKVFKVDNKDDSLLLVVKKEKADTSKDCYILTRLAYDRDTDYKDNMDESRESYLTLSRTLIINDKEKEEENSRNTDNIRVFYNAYVRENDQNDTLRKAGGTVFDSFAVHVMNHIVNDSTTIATLSFSKNRKEFAEKFRNQVYTAIIEGEKKGETVDIEYKNFEVKNLKTWKSTFYNGKIRIFLPVLESTPENWHHAKIIEGFDTNTDFEIRGKVGEQEKYMEIYNRIFSCKENQGYSSLADPLECKREDGKIHNWIDLNPKPEHDKVLHYGYITRKNSQKEAREIDWFPGKDTADGPIQSIYRYSRTESRIPITLYRGRWYHIHVRWEKNRLLITEFEVSFKKMKDTDAQELNDISTSDNDTAIIKTEPGKLRKNLLSGPGRVWVLNKSGSEFSQYPTEYKTYCYCPNCVIYYSKYRDVEKTTDSKKKNWRYWPDEKQSIYNGKFNLENMHAEHKNPKYFYYGTVAWTQFAPENKQNNNTDNKEQNGAMFWVTINGDEKQFYSWGEEKKSSKDLENPNSIFMKEYSTNKNMPFKFDLHDNNNEGEDSASHLETTIVDRVVLYMIVQPQPIHWSYNTYKDKNLYQKQ